VTDCGAVLVAVALGSNLGDRARILDAAVAALRSLLDDVAVSTYHDTDPVGVPGPQPRYLNAAVVGRTTRPARDVLDELQAIETAMGRTRPHANAPRTLDLDLILYGALTLETPALAVPHPRFRERRFVLEPLAEIAPDLRDPVTGQTVTELLAARSKS
jgi:2-amino-4-hydroxy-6-hydroxymethyldihydropteridine diphosphokinase